MLNAHNEDGEDGAIAPGSTDPEESKGNNKERGKTVKFQSQNDDISNRDSGGCVPTLLTLSTSTFDLWQSVSFDGTARVECVCVCKTCEMLAGST